MSSMGLFETSAIMVSETWTPVKDEKIHKVFQSSEDLLIGISTSTHGWYIKKNLCSFVLLAGGLGLLTESVSELPGKKKDVKYRKVFKKLPYHFCIDTDDEGPREDKAAYLHRGSGLFNVINIAIDSKSRP